MPPTACDTWVDWFGTLVAAHGAPAQLHDAGQLISKLLYIICIQRSGLARINAPQELGSPTCKYALVGV